MDTETLSPLDQRLSERGITIGDPHEGELTGLDPNPLAWGFDCPKLRKRIDGVPSGGQRTRNRPSLPEVAVLATR